MDDDIPHLRPISQSLQELIGYSKGSRLSTNLSVKTDPVTAVQRAKLLAGCYRKSDASDPETYAGAVSAVLAEYAPDIVQRVTDPRTGLPSKLQWLPSVKEVRDACEELDARQRYLRERAKQEAEQVAELRRMDAARQTRPTLAEMRAKYGDNWGIAGEDKTMEAERARRRSELQQRANQTIFARECEAAGMPSDSPVSPQLAALIKAGMA